MARARRWLHTDEFADTESSLRKAAQTVALVKHDLSEWKWLLESVHSATQGLFVLALSRGNGLLTLKSTHAAAWLEAYESGGPWPQKLDLDYFLELYAKAKEHALRGSGFAATTAHDEAMTKLNDLRNGFIHFGAQGWSIQLAGLPSICIRCLEVAEHLGWMSGAVRWRSAAQSRRAKQALRALTRDLSSLSNAYGK